MTKAYDKGIKDVYDKGIKDDEAGLLKHGLNDTSPCYQGKGVTITVTLPFINLQYLHVGKVLK